MRDFQAFEVSEENGFLDLRAEPVYDRAGRRITGSEAEAFADAIEADEVEVDETNVVYPRGCTSFRGT